MRRFALRSIWVIVAAITVSAAHLPSGAGDQGEYRVGVDPRVELMSIIFRLAGNSEYNQGVLKSYLDDIDAHFGPHKDHAAIKFATKLRQTRGVSFDAVMGMAIH